MNNSSFAVVRTTRTAVEADMMIAALRATGLHPLELNTWAHCTLIGGDQSYYIEVPKSELSEATALLESYPS